MEKIRIMAIERKIVKIESTFVRKTKKFLILLIVEIVLAIMLLVVIQFFK